MAPGCLSRPGLALSGPVPLRVRERGRRSRQTARRHNVLCPWGRGKSLRFRLGGSEEACVADTCLHASLLHPAPQPRARRRRRARRGRPALSDCDLRPRGRVFPRATINDIEEDRDGYAWFATQSGVGRFDGATFETLTVADGLPANLVMALEVDDEDRSGWGPMEASPFFRMGDSAGRCGSRAGCGRSRGRGAANLGLASRRRVDSNRGGPGPHAHAGRRAPGRRDLLHRRSRRRDLGRR